MTETARGTDLGVGLALAFGLLSIVAALATTATAYISAIDHSAYFQTLSGVSVALALVFGGLAVTALHVYGSDSGP